MLKQTYEAFHKTGKKVIVILNVGGVIETAPIQDYADAILLAWQPGLEAGNSIVDVLTGQSTPSGKLPMTWPIALDNIPSTKNFPDGFTWREEMLMSPAEICKLPNLGNTRYEEGLNVGYRFFQTANKEVSYPFGFGMSYTNFKYSDAKVQRRGDKYIASVTITNTGNYSGK